jgi:hypothetical protein
MDKVNIQIDPAETLFSRRIYFILMGLLCWGIVSYSLWVYQSQSSNPVMIFATVAGWIGIFQGFGLNIQNFNIFKSPKNLFFIVRDMKIAYNLTMNGETRVIEIDNLNSISCNKKKDRFFFRLNDGREKTLSLNIIPEDKRKKIIEGIQLVSVLLSKRLTDQMGKIEIKKYPKFSTIVGDRRTLLISVLIMAILMATSPWFSIWTYGKYVNMFLFFLASIFVILHIRNRY